MMCLTCTGTSTVQDIYKKLCNIAPHRLVMRLHENAPMLSEISGENTASLFVRLAVCLLQKLKHEPYNLKKLQWRIPHDPYDKNIPVVLCCDLDLLLISWSNLLPVRGTMIH